MNRSWIGTMPLSRYRVYAMKTTSGFISWIGSGVASVASFISTPDFLFEWRGTCLRYFDVLRRVWVANTILGGIR